jgi:lysyl-tRNA synthetase class 1
MFLDKGGKKISKSAGNVFTPQVWFNYGSPQSLLLLMLKRFVGTRTLDVSDIPAYINELDYMEDIYFGKKQVGEKEATRLKGIFQYCYVMKPPAKPSIHVPYTLMAFLVKMAPKECINDYITEKLQSYGYLQKGQTIDSELQQRIQYAINWTTDFEEIKETNVELTAEERKAITEFVEKLKTENDPDAIQNSIFNAAKGNGIKPGSLFKTLYQVLMGAPQGPRLGPYVLAMGKSNVVAALERVLSGKKEEEA